MVSPSPKGPREETAPFLLQLFYRTGGFHRPGDFALQPLPPHVPVYTWPDCTLDELALELASADPSPLPFPAIGTRLAFQLVFPDLRNAGAGDNGPPRFTVRDLGTIVVGEGGPGAGVGDEGETDGNRSRSHRCKTLNEARFVVGDYVSCAILPPLGDGSVAPAAGVRRESSTATRDSRGGLRGGFQGRENGFGRGAGRGGRVWRDDFASGFPMGDWKRGERLPEGPGGGRPRGRGRW